jgi:hypothetical protein
MWFLPLLVLGAIAVAAASRSSSRPPAPPSRQLAAPPPPVPAVAGWSIRSSARPGVPGPISVLGELLRVGQVPPPPVILCAIAEAQAIGRHDLASDIAQAFVAPVVRQDQRGKSRSAYERGTCALPRSPRGAVNAPPVNAASYWAPPPGVVNAAPANAPVNAVKAPVNAAPYWAQPPLETIVMPQPAAPPPPPPGVAPSPPVAAPPAPPPAAPQPTPTPSTEEEFLAMLNADPARFMEAQIAHQQPRAQVVVYPPGQRPDVAAAPPHAPQPMGLPPEALAQMQEAAGFRGAADQTRAMAPGSPLGGVSDESWRQFVARLSREAPEFSSSRHVGQYRQRRERLAELGIDPRAIHESASAQRAALDADLADAHRHAAAGGVLADHLGRPVTVPGRDVPETLTLSGLLGVIQCAGLEGAVGWLENPNDRKRYPHTTQAFLHTNGVF